ncbi:MAG: hypothetical protein PW844_05950 [Pantoea sp.]|uniref:hypothetical protein n=1 Tax=Pantoea sp. TaxID=69393 RepID=UPI00238C3001|nr:hypothetical protein [Pantoea sp.]MDE1186009.1 hypothetical protein [Pantoea sp.]
MILNKYRVVSVLFIAAVSISVQADIEVNDVPFSVNLSGTPADIRLQQRALFSDLLLKAEKVYTIDMDPEHLLTFSKGQPVQSLTVNFKTQSQLDKAVKSTELKIILPEGVVRSTQGDIEVRCSQHADCKPEFDNSWTGKGGHQLLIRGMDLQPGESYSVTMPVTLEKTLPADLASVEATIGQSASVKEDSTDRIVAPNSVISVKKAVKVETRVTIHALKAAAQKIINAKIFSAHVVAEGMESTDKLSLTDGTQTWPMTLQPECDVKDASCFSAELPIPSNPFTFSLTAVVIAQNEELNRTQLVTPLKDDSTAPFIFLVQCSQDPLDDRHPCTLGWGDENRPAPIPYLADDGWLTLSNIYKHRRITAESYQAINEAIKESGPLKLRITNVGWSPLDPFKNQQQAPTINSERMDTDDKDVHGLLTPGGILPQYGTLFFFYDL